MNIVSANLDREYIESQAGKDVDRVVEFVVRKSVYVGGFPSEPLVEYRDERHARTKINTELNIFLSGFGCRVQYAYDSKAANEYEYRLIKPDRTEVSLFRCITRNNELYIS